MPAAGPATRLQAGNVTSWLVPALAYVLIAGALGVVSKLALEDLTWQQITFWTTLVYVGAGVVLLVRIDWRPAVDSGNVAALASGALAAIALVALFVALGNGDVGQVVPVTSAYPVVTLILASSLLGERVTRRQIAGTLMIVLGVVVLTVF